MRQWVPVALVALAVSACSGATPDDVAVAIDGGTAQVALLGDVVVAAEPGATVTVRHATPPEVGSEAPMTHALVATPADDLPPVFDQGAGGIVPNPAVWGPCRGGEPAAATGQCPVAAVDGPQAWDGRTYWSLGAMLPGEERELPLSRELPDGDHALVCALHPQLRLVVRVGAEGTPSARDTEGQVGAARHRAAEIAATAGRRVVVAGIDVDDPPAYVSSFSPDVMHVDVGDAVTWRAGARAPVDVVFGADHEELSLSHTTPADGLPSAGGRRWNGRGILRSGFLSADPAAGASATEWTVRFTRPGTYTYASRFSDQMGGTVVVEEDAR